MTSPAGGREDALFTPRFFALFTFTFTVFMSAFQLFPTAPYRILGIGGSTAMAGLFLGGHFPAFNLADSAISLGAVLLLLDEWLRVRRGR